MESAVVSYLPWLLSAVTIWMTLMAGNKHRLAWVIGLCNQALWLGWIICADAWGLIPMNLALWVVYARNHLKWSAPIAAAPEPPISRPTIREDHSLHEQVLTMFAKHGAPLPGGRLRDELIVWLMWARHGVRLQDRRGGQ